jgi:hypothetical protein
MRHVRNNAFSLNIVGRNEDPNHPVPLIAMMEIRGQLVAFKTNGIFHIYTADEIDPERKHPQAKGTYKQVYDVRTASPFVSRTIIQASEILNTVHLKSNTIKTLLLEIVYDSMRELLNCHAIQSELKREIEDFLPICDTCIRQSRTSLFIKDLPQVKNLRNRFNDFFLSAKRFLQSTMRILEICFDKPANGARFRKDIEWAEKTFGRSDPIAQQLRDDNRWMFLIVSVRNYIEHPDVGLSIELRNFEHTVDNKFMVPAWRYNLRNYEQDFFSDACQDMDHLCNNMLEFAEELFCLSIRKVWDVKWPFFIYRVPEERIDPQRPMRYAVSLDFEQLTGKLPRRQK